MYCDVNNIPIQGILGQILHLSLSQSKHGLGRYELKPGQAGMLFMLRDSGGLSQKELASRLGLTPPSITAALKKMEGLHFIERRPDEKDQRIMRLNLTDAGRECIEHLKHVTAELDEVLFQGMSPEERLLLRRLLIQMRENLMAGRDLNFIHPPID